MLVTRSVNKIKFSEADYMRELANYLKDSNEFRPFIDASIL